MSYRSWQEYVASQRRRYRRGARAEKGRILDEGCVLFGVHRKSLVRAFARDPRRARKRPGPRARYGREVLEPLKAIWLASGQPCSKRLKAVVRLWLGAYERRAGPLAEALRRDLLAVSAATMDRLLQPVRARRRRGLCGTQRARHLEGQIPIRTHFQEVDGPGYFEADTVAHCGESMAGAFVWSLTLTDIWSGWTENRAVWNKNGREVAKRLQDIEQGLPFEIEGFDSDNGREFLNYHVLRYLRDRPVPVEFTRSRPYRKNDNAHVEQKQWTHVRQLVGYDRFEDRRLVGMLNDLYRNDRRLLVNYFFPTMQLVSKTRDGGRITRRHGPPETPYERLMRSAGIDKETKARLRKEFESLDPFALHEACERKLAAVLRVVRRQSKNAKTGRGAARSVRKTRATRAVEMPPCDQPAPTLAPLA